MSIRVVFEISNRDLQRFRSEMRRARRSVTGTAAEDILDAADRNRPVVGEQQVAARIDGHDVSHDGVVRSVALQYLV